MSEELTKEDIIKEIDGEVYYYVDYADFLYEQLEMRDEKIKNLTKLADALEKELIDIYEFETGDTTHIKEVIKQIKEEI